MKLGYKFNIGDIKEDKKYKNKWIYSNVSIKTYIYIDSNDLIKTKESNDVVRYDSLSKEFVVEEIGSGYIEITNQLDPTISIKFPYKTTFKSEDTNKLIEENNYNFNEDNYISKNEIESIQKITISNYKKYDLIDFINFNSLKNIYISDKNDILVIDNKPNCTYFVNSYSHSSYITDNGWNELSNNIYPFTSNDIDKITVFYMFDSGRLDNSNVDSYLTSLDVNTKKEKIDDITPSKQGYLFDGWYVFENGKATNNKISKDYIYDSNITLIAKWNEINYKIKYNSSKDTKLPSNLSLTYKEIYKICDNILTYDRYTFIGWSLNSEAKIADF